MFWNAATVENNIDHWSEKIFIFIFWSNLDMLCSYVLNVLGFSFFNDRKASTTSNLVICMGILLPLSISLMLETFWDACSGEFKWNYPTLSFHPLQQGCSADQREHPSFYRFLCMDGLFCKGSLLLRVVIS